MKIDCWSIAFLLFCLLLVVSTMANSGDLKQALWSNTIIPMSIVLLVKCGISKKEKLTVLVLFFLYNFFGLCNLITVIANRSDPTLTNFLYTNRNNHIFFNVIPLFCGYYAIERGYIKNRVIWFCFYIVCVVSALFSGGASTVAIIAVWGLFLFPRINRLFSKRKVILICYFMDVVLVFAIVLYTLCNAQFMDGVVSLLGKTNSFNERKFIWTSIWDMIREKPILGHGACDLMEIIGYRHAHNIYLQVLFNRGVLGICLLVGLIVLLDFKIRKVVSLKIRALMWMMLMCFLFAGQVEVGYIQFYALYGSLIYYLSELNEDKSNS